LSVRTWRFSARARSDLRRLWDFIEQRDGPAPADAVVNQITVKLALLAEYPMIGRARPELRRGIRGYPVAGHTIFYRVLRNSIMIVHVLHGHMDHAQAVRR
jgi:toxin ParE1/3/4